MQLTSSDVDALLLLPPCERTLSGSSTRALWPATCPAGTRAREEALASDDTIAIRNLPPAATLSGTAFGEFLRRPPLVLRALAHRFVRRHLRLRCPLDCSAHDVPESELSSSAAAPGSPKLRTVRALGARDTMTVIGAAGAGRPAGKRARGRSASSRRRGAGDRAPAALEVPLPRNSASIARSSLNATRIRSTEASHITLRCQAPSPSRSLASNSRQRRPLWPASDPSSSGRPAPKRCRRDHLRNMLGRTASNTPHWDSEEYSYPVLRGRRHRGHHHGAGVGS